MYEITVTKEFAAGHAIRLPDDTLEPVHGHNWRVTVTAASEELDGIETVMDFHILEAALQKLLDTVHNKHLNECAPFAGKDGALAVNPTAERVAWWIGQSLISAIKLPVKLVSVEVTEAPGCAAKWIV